MQSMQTLVIATLVVAGCSSGEQSQLSEQARAGEKIYQNVCIACHNGDPNRDGSLGPANAGASAELLDAKVVRGEYPPGYTPKRPDSHAMPRFAHLADDIPALTAYLNEVKKDPDPR